MSILTSFITSGIIKGPGIMDGVKIIENEFYKKPGEKDRDFALREAVRMSTIVSNKSVRDWIFDPNSMRFYVLEAWGRIFEFEKSNLYKVDNRTKESFERANDKLRNCNLHLNIIPAKLFLQITDKPKYFKVVTEYYLMWLHAIASLLAFGMSNELPDFVDELVEIDDSMLPKEMEKIFNQKRDVLGSLIDDMIDAIAEILDSLDE